MSLIFKTCNIIHLYNNIYLNFAAKTPALAVGENPLLIVLSIIFTVVKLCCKNAIELSVLQSSLTITSYVKLVFCNA